MSEPECDDMAELLSVFLEESGLDEREWHETQAQDGADLYRAHHPEAPATMSRATLRALNELEAHMPAHLRAKVWPAESAAGDRSASAGRGPEERAGA